jgi:serine/threonine protein kinase
MLNTGDILQQGRYRVNRQLGAGGMATVYEVFDRRLQTKYALKAAVLHSAEEQAQFEQEVQLLAQLDHPVLPRVLDHFSERGHHVLVMELIPGDDLEGLLRAQGHPFDVALVLHWADQLLDALEYLHAQNPSVVHRDIKPANLKLAGTGRIKLLDFGIAKQHAIGSQTVTVAKAYSLEYSPIEQFSMRTHTDPRSDLYALGATLYHLLTNHAPTSAPDRAGGQPLLGPQSFNPDCPPALAQTLLRAMALKPEHRYQSAGEFRAALQHVREQISGGAAPTRRRRKHLLLGSTATAVVALLGYIVGSLVFGSGPVRPSAAAAPTSVPVVMSAPTATSGSAMSAAALATVLTVPTTPPTSAPAAAQPSVAATPAPAEVPQQVRVTQPPIISRSAWGAAPATGSNGAQQPRRITLNHDGQPLAGSRDIPDMLRRIQDIHQRQWVDIAWHYIIDRDGNIYEGHAPTDRGDTNYHYDTDGMIAIGILGDYDTQSLTPQQKEAIVALMAWLCQQYNIAPSDIYPHSYFANQSPKTDPKITSPGRNVDMDDIRRQVAGRLAGT